MGTRHLFRALAKDSIVYTIATIMSRGIQIILIPLYTRFLDPAQFGVSDLLQVGSNLALILFSIEIIQAVARYYPAERDPKAKREISSTGLFFVSLNYLICTVLVLIFADPLSKALFGAAASASIVRTAALAFICSGIFNYLQSQLRWDMRSLDYSIASIVYIVCSASASILFIVGLNYGVAGVFLGQAAGAIIAGTVSFLRNRKMYGLVYSLPRLRKMIAFSAPFVISSVCVILSTYIDRFFIKKFCDLPSVGVYGIAARLSSIVQLVFVGFGVALTPLIYSNAESKELPGNLAKLFSMFLPVAALFAAGAFLFSDEILHIFTTPKFYGAAIVAPFLVCGAIAAGLYQFFPGMSIAKDTSPIILISAVTMVSSGTLNALLVPSFGILGASLSSVGTGVVSAFMYFLFSQKRYRIPFRLWTVIASTIIILVSSLTAVGIKNLVKDQVGSILAKAVIWLAICGGAIATSRPLKEIIFKAINSKKISIMKADR
jgi:O-antigen/teichoic acid export membrane protein